MTLNNHTPGPWRHDRDDNRYGAVVSDVPPGCEGHDTSGYGGYLIAESISGMANRDLIAAAPDLLESLEEVLRMTTQMFDGLMPAWRRRACDAVMKARGLR